MSWVNAEARNCAKIQNIPPEPYQRIQQVPPWATRIRHGTYPYHSPDHLCLQKGGTAALLQHVDGGSIDPALQVKR